MRVRRSSPVGCRAALLCAVDDARRQAGRTADPLPANPVERLDADNIWRCTRGRKTTCGANPQNPLRRRRAAHDIAPDQRANYVEEIPAGVVTQMCL